MIKIRFKELSTGKYSVYLDIYAKNSEGKSKRNYDFLGIQVTQDYSKVKRIKEEDKEKMRRVDAIKAKRELDLIDESHGLSRKKKMLNNDIFNPIEEIQKITPDINVYSALKNLKTFANRSKLPCSDVDYAFLDDFWKYLNSKIAFNSSIVYFKRLHSYINKAIQRGLLSENPFTGYKLPNPQDVHRVPLSFDEINLLNNTATEFNPIIRKAFFFSCFTGLRFGDIKNLRWQDIEDGKIVLRQQKTFDKTGHIQYLPINSEAKKILDELMNEKHGDLVFFDLPNNATVNVNLKLWAKEAGLNKRLHFHLARHTFGTIGITYGVDLYTMQKLLGHSTPEMTKHYAKIVDEKMQNEVDKFPSFSASTSDID